MAYRIPRPVVAVGAVACLAVLTACGSQVPPSEFVGLNNNLGGGPQASASGSVAPGIGPGGTLPSGTATGSKKSGGGGSTGNPGGGGGGGSTGNPGGGGGGGSGPAAASCNGFKNGPGITNSTVTVANASDISGPVPGLFTSAQQATKAFVAYFNSTSSICGRKISVELLDSGTSATGDQQAATTACSNAFAMVGSMSAFDLGGADTVSKCGIPDLRAVTVTPGRYNAPVSFGTDAIATDKISSMQYDYFKQTGGDAYKHAALVYLNAGAAQINAQDDVKAGTKLGYDFVYNKGIDVTTFNYTPYVSDMQSKGVKFIQWTGSYQNAIRLKQAMDSQNYHPIFLMDSVAYDPNFISSGSSTVNGVYSFVNTQLFEEASSSQEMSLYFKWLQTVAPGAKPSFFGIYAWGAARLFTQLATQLGGNLSRTTLLTAIKGVHNYTSNNLFAAQDVGGKITSPCEAMIQVVNGKWTRKSPAPWTCHTVVSAN